MEALHLRMCRLCVRKLFEPLVRFPCRLVVGSHICFGIGSSIGDLYTVVTYLEIRFFPRSETNSDLPNFNPSLLE